ncbi:MAG: hypothetical protein V9F03_13340 [Microthrixaceae bacterium]
MGNLGGYQDITTAAKAAGGPEKLIAIIQAEAAKRAATGQRAQGALLTLGVVAMVVAGKRVWYLHTARRAASTASANAATVELTALIDFPDTDADESSNEPNADDKADQGGAES